MTEIVKLCPKCNHDSLITMSDGTYCMMDSCTYYKEKCNDHGRITTGKGDGLVYCSKCGEEIKK